MRERHPIPAPPTGLPLDQRVLLLENRLAQLWDEVWWHQLPWYRRLGYWLQGFRSPITRFYIAHSDSTSDLELKL
jgi:hypothetical protein